MQSLTPYLFILGTVAGTSLGQFLVKAGVDAVKKTAPETSLQFIISSLLNPLIILGLAMAFGAFLSWIFAMRHFPLNYAYPFTALNITIVFLLSSVIFNEQIPPIYWLGFFLIVSGVGVLFFARV